MAKEFAPGFDRNDDGWILFPRDVQDRKSLFFPDEVMAHPAKMNFHLQQAIIEYMAKEGDVLLDPFGGTGTLMIAAIQGYRVILIEIEEGYHKLQQQAKEELNRQIPSTGELVILLHGDNRLLLPIPCNHVITSPPYVQAMNIKKVSHWAGQGNDDKASLEMAEQDRRMIEYSRSPRNMSKLNQFLYNQEIRKVYSLCYQSLPTGGTMTTVIKDRIHDGERVYLSKWANKVCEAVGFRLELWEKWLTPGTRYTKDRKAKGEEVVEDEDVLIYRKV